MLEWAANISPAHSYFGAQSKLGRRQLTCGTGDAIVISRRAKHATLIELISHERSIRDA